jgi:predicted N-acetyltransferase YhbS
MRGKGLGLALLQLGLEHLARMGVENAVIDWTGLVDFYGRVGFTPWKTYARMEC